MSDTIARGPNFVYTKEYILRVYGEQTWLNVLGKLPAEYANEWRKNLLLSGNYSFTAYKALVKALSIERKLATNQEIAQLYEYIAEHSLNTIYKIFFKMMQPSFVIKNYSQLWQRFFNAGKVEVPIAEKGHAVVNFHLPELFEDWLEPACYGYSKKAVELAGGKQMKQQLLRKNRLTNGEWEFSYKITWVEGK
jgi:hypothetical protein